MSCSAELMDKFRDSVPETATMRDLHEFCEQNKILSLAQGVIEIPPPKNLLSLCVEEVSKPIHTYRPGKGCKEMIEAVRSILLSQEDVSISPEAILVTSGVSGGIAASLLMAKHHGFGKAALFNPFYTFHQWQISQILGSEPIYVELHLPSFNINWEELEKAFAMKEVGVFIFCNPANPTGKVYSEDNVKKLIRLGEKHNVLIICDEIYSDLVWNENFYSPLEMGCSPNVIVCRGFSKSLGCQSWRVGYLLSSPDRVAHIASSHDTLYLGSPFVQGAIGRYILNDFGDYCAHLEKLRKVMQANIHSLKKAFVRVFNWDLIEPEGSMYVFFKHNESSDYEAVMKALKKGVGVASGSMFFKGNPKRSGYIRIHAGISEHKVIRLCEELEQEL